MGSHARFSLVHHVFQSRQVESEPYNRQIVQIDFGSTGSEVS